jgi:hypothetical protein
MTPAEIEFAKLMVSESKKSDHPFPGYAAAEAFLESASFSSVSGQSGLASRDKDVFGIKSPSWWVGKIDSIVTREVVNGVSEMVQAKWPVFETYADCFAARLKVLQSVPIYSEALEAKTGDEFIRLVSAEWVPMGTLPTSTAHPLSGFLSGVYQFKKSRWSTDPFRAKKVLITYNSHLDIFGE